MSLSSHRFLWDIFIQFGYISGDAQKLFVRILCRKHTWISATKMKYAEVGESFDHLLVELKTNGFLETSEYFESKVSSP